MALKAQQTALFPILKREIAQHQPATSVQVILNILQQAELGNLIAQADLFTDMEERDAHIYAEITKRRMAIAQLDWALEPARRKAGAREKRAVAELEERLRDALDIETLVFDMSDAIGHGFSMQEIEWSRVNGYWLPKSISARPQRWFTVDTETRQQLRLRDNRSIDGVELQPFGWIEHRHASKTGYPATQGLFRVLALPYLFKNFATRNWLRFCELYAVPIRVLFTQEQDEGKKTDLLIALRELGQSGAALLTGGKANEDLQTVNAATGEGQGFDALINWCERSVSKAILGGTLTSQADGRTSTNALGNIHDDVRYQLRDHDAKQIAATLTRQLIGAIITVNALPIEARWTFDTQAPEDLTLYADALPKLAAVGMRIPVAWAQEKLRIPEPEGDEAILGTQTPVPAQATPEPADNPQQNPDDVGDNAEPLAAKLPPGPPKFTLEQQAVERLANSAIAADAQLIDQRLIQAAIRAARDPEDLADRLAAIASEADPAEFRTIMERALFAADLMGYAHAG